MKHFLSKALQIVVPFLLGGGILYWMYRDSDFSQIREVLLHRMRWEWMLLSFVPGVLAQVFRALRWRQSLMPLGEHCRAHTAVCAIFLSYAASLVVPRVGEFLRCGVLKRKDGVSFAKSLGTVVTERVVDIVLMLILVTVIIVWQWEMFAEFFALTGMSLRGTLARFTQTGIWVSVICFAGIMVLLAILVHKLAIMHKVKAMVQDMWEGILSLRKVSNVPLYIFYSVAIWVAYFFHYYLTFYCFDFTENIGLAAGLVSFCTGGIAVLVPTPNGAGSWHFAVKTILVLYGLSATAAIIFALIVHTVQTLLLVALGVYALIALQMMQTHSHDHAPQNMVNDKL